MARVQVASKWGLQMRNVGRKATIQTVSADIAPRNPLGSVARMALTCLDRVSNLEQACRLEDTYSGLPPRGLCQPHFEWAIGLAGGACNPNNIDGPRRHRQDGELNNNNSNEHIIGATRGSKGKGSCEGFCDCCEEISSGKVRRCSVHTN